MFRRDSIVTVTREQLFYVRFDTLGRRVAWKRRLRHFRRARVDGEKKTGYFSSDKVTVFLEDYIGLCSVKIEGRTDVCTRLVEYLKSLPRRNPMREKETIIKEREIVTMPCTYCRAREMTITSGERADTLVDFSAIANARLRSLRKD